MLNNNNKLVFNKLIAEIQGTFLKRVISKYNSDFRSQHFDTKSHLYALLYSNFMNCKIKDFPPLRIIDSSVMVTALKLAPSLKFDNEKLVLCLMANILSI